VGNEAESIRGEAGALVELELLQHVAPGTDELSEVVVRDDHVAEAERLEALERRGELGDPGAGVGAPVVGYEAIHGRAGLPVHGQRLEPRELREQARRGHGVAEGHRDVLPREHGRGRRRWRACGRPGTRARGRWRRGRAGGGACAGVRACVRGAWPAQGLNPPSPSASDMSLGKVFFF